MILPTSALLFAAVALALPHLHPNVPQEHNPKLPSAATPTPLHTTALMAGAAISQAQATAVPLYFPHVNIDL
ncbi:hypothetical protein EJ06DRAFT_533422 [Trichodelitschia bisporula]|uniref:Uncharacterized protein n=1 Tax=Trichodelitschia bisporula TaxID=703511 RepID=A0A6G1HN05_9PEZI|nr:hypothetical protein EJ06DRAFT_533422 [Trichodelitschia bisporula]